MRKSLLALTLLVSSVFAAAPAQAELVSWDETDGSVFAARYGELFALHLDLGVRPDANRTMLPASKSWRSDFAARYAVRSRTVRGAVCSVRYELTDKLSGKRALSPVFVFDCDGDKPALASGYLHPSAEHVVLKIGDRYYHVSAPK